jgi:hypothetical protein
MHEGILEIHEHQGEGYKALVDYGGWRVAILRFQDELLPERQTSMERHIETDEVFVLTKGQGLLLLGGNGPQVDELAVQAMEIGKIYNIKKSVWHTVALSRDASVVIVENQDTERHNSEYVDLSAEQRQWIQTAAGGSLAG